MKRYDFFYRQKVKEAELDEAFDAAEASDQGIVSALGLEGLVFGGDVGQKAPTPNLTVAITGPIVGYDVDGNRIYVAGSSINVDVSVDENSASTAVGTVGHERYISLFVKFERSLSDPRLDGSGATVFYVRDESYEFVVASGATAPLGTATRPVLRAGHILLADILIVNGQTSVVDADIFTDRTEYSIRLTGTSVAVTARTYEEALQSLLDAINNLADGTISLDAAVVTYDNATSGLAATDVQAAIDEVDSDLDAHIASATAHTAANLVNTPAGTIAATTVQAALNELDGDIVRLGDEPTWTGLHTFEDGMDLTTGGALNLWDGVGINLDSGGIFATVGAITAAANSVIASSSQVWPFAYTGPKSFVVLATGVVVGGGDLQPPGAGGSSGVVFIGFNDADGGELVIPQPPHGATLTRIRAAVSLSAEPTTLDLTMVFKRYRHDKTAPFSIASTTAATFTKSTTGNQVFDSDASGPISVQIDRTQDTFVCTVTPGKNGAASVNTTCHWIELTFTMPGAVTS